MHLCNPVIMLFGIRIRQDQSEPMS